MSRGIIYLITNKENGHKYVGQTTQPMNKTWQQHIMESNKMSQKPLHRAFRKYGVHRFNIQEIDECDVNVLNEREEYWIKYYNTFESNEGYNATSGEEKPIFDQETKDKLSVIISTDVWTQNISNSLKEKAKKESWGLLTPENRGDGKHSGLKIRGKNLENGLCKDYENARMAALEITGDANKNGNILLAARRGGTAYNHKWLILEEKTKKKPVFGVNKKTELIEVRYESIAEAIRQLGLNSRGTGIMKSLRNPGKYSWRGYWWFYG